MEQFRFVSEPFNREIRIDHRLAFDFIDQEVKAIKMVVEKRQSAVLIAPPGSGKTVAVRALKAALPEARYRFVYLKLADISMRDMCQQIASAIGAEKSGLFPSLVRNIDERLKAGFDGGLRPVVVFDDAHELRRETLRLVRILTNFEMDSRLIVSMVLVGHPSLKDLLLRPEVEDVRQRLSHCGELRSLTREETKDYIDHRVKIAGSSQNPFDPLAMEAIFEIARGNMRTIDRLSTAALALANKAGRGRVETSDVAAARATLWI